MKTTQIFLFALFCCISISNFYGQHFINDPIEINRGSNGQSSFITNNHNPFIWSTQNTPTLPYPFTDGDLGHLVIQPRTSSPRDILFVTGDGDDIRMSIKGDGNVGIGTQNPGTYRLAVNGNVRAKEIKVETGWSDFVFKNDYRLPTLEEVEEHIKDKGHLKDIPSAEEVAENGILLGEMDSKLLQKIEELTLYMIDMNKQIQQLQKENAELRKER